MRNPYVAGVLLVLAFVGYRYHQNNSYSGAVESNFVAGCTNGHGAEAQVPCQCVYDRLKATVPFDQFKEFEKQMEINPRPESWPAWLTSTVQACAPQPTG